MWFIQNINCIMMPIIDCMKQGPLEWTKEANKAIELIKHKLV